MHGHSFARKKQTHKKEILGYWLTAVIRWFTTTLYHRGYPAVSYTGIAAVMKHRTEMEKEIQLVVRNNADSE